MLLLAIQFLWAVGVFFIILAALLRDICIFFLRVASSLPELWAAVKALAFAKRYFWNKIWLESDYRVAVQLLTIRSLLVPWSIWADWSCCLDFIASTDFNVFKIYWEANMVANSLSKLDVSSLSSEWLFLLSLQSVCYHVDDRWGTLLNFIRLMFYSFVICCLFLFG